MTGTASHTRPKLAVATTFPIHPPRGGGQVRIFELYRELARVYDVEVVTLGLPGTTPTSRLIAPGLRETRVPKSNLHAQRERVLEVEAGTLVADVAMSLLYRDTPAYVKALGDAVRDAHAVVASHPYTWPVIQEVADAPLWYEAQDVEVCLKADILAGSPGADELLRQTERVERACCVEADLIWACSDEDRTELSRRYGVALDKVLVVPNGVALEDIDYVAAGARREHKHRLGMDDRCLAVFIGSWHAPNVAALQTLLDLAPDEPEVDFLCLGSVAMALTDAQPPDNLDLAGPFASEFKRAVLSVADLALNPVTMGSGTNLKMLEYFASGTPVVSTVFGARGLGVTPGRHYVAADPADFAQAIEAARRADERALADITETARAHVEEHLTWRVIASDLLASLSGC